MSDLAAEMWVAHSGWSVVGRMMVCIGKARGLFALAVAAVEAESRAVLGVRCLVMFRVVVQVDFHMMAVFAEPEEVLGSKTGVVYSADLVGSHAALWHTVCCRSQLHWVHAVRKHRRLEAVSFLCAQWALVR